MIYESFNFDPWYSESILIGLFKHIGSVNFTDPVDVSQAISHLKIIGKHLFNWMHDYISFIDAKQLISLEAIYWDLVKQFEQHEGVDIQKNQKILSVLTGMIKFLIEMLIDEYMDQEITGVCNEMMDAVDSLKNH